MAGPDLDWQGWFVIFTLAFAFIIMAMDKVCIMVKLALLGPG